MPSPPGWREVPCVECGQRVPDIDFNERCPECTKRRRRRADLVARRVALLAAALAAAWSWSLPPTDPGGQWYAVIAVPVVAVLVYKIAGRVAWEVLK